RLFVLEAAFGLGGILVDIALGQKQRLGSLAELRAQCAGLDQAGFGTVAVAIMRGRGHLALLMAKKQNPAGRIILGPGSRVPGLLATCFTWLQAGRLKSPRDKMAHTPRPSLRQAGASG